MTIYNDIKQLESVGHLHANSLVNADCLEAMKFIPDKSIDLILADLPYGTTACKWDVIIPFDLLWKQYERIIKDNGAIVLTADEPFTSMLNCSNLKLFRYKWIWDKIKPNGFLNSKKMPMKMTEDICVFYKKLPTYNPIITIGNIRKKKAYKRSDIFSGGEIKSVSTINNEKFPINILRISNANQINKIHPTQKPVTLMEYLIKTYTNEGETVLDNCFGSCTTGVACKNLNRNFIGIEKDEKYFEIGMNRVLNHQVEPIKLTLDFERKNISSEHFKEALKV